MMTRRVVSMTAVAVALSFALRADTIQKANNADDLYLGSSWVGGIPPGQADVALWDSTVAGANSAELGADMTLDGLRILNPGGLVTVGGTNILTLDGGQAVDLDLASASQDLMLDTALALAGSQAADVAAGRALVFNAPVVQTGTSFVKNGGTGRIVIRDAFDVQAGSVEQFGIYKGTVVLDGADSALTMNSRFFFGRSSSDSDATLIVSNGVHSAAGNNDDAMANFIGVSAGRGDLFMEGGVFSCLYLRLGCNDGQGLAITNNLIVNGGELHVTGATGTAIDSKAFTMGANHPNNTTQPATQSARVEVNGGLFNIPNGTFQIGSLNNASTGWQGVFLNGGVLAVKRVEVGSTTGSPKEIVFNGGLLRIVNAAADGEIINGSANLTVTVQSGGALIDSGNRSMTLSQDLQGDPAAPGGGLVKSGAGTLTLSGACSYTGKTVVSNGTLKISGSLATADIVVAPGAAFSMADGAISEYEPDSFRAGSALAPATVELEVASDGSANDCIVLKEGSRLYRVAVRLYQVGTTDNFYITGAYPVFKFTGAPPAIGGLFWDADVPGYKCEFSVDAQSGTVVAEIQYDDAGSTYFWTAPGGGNWETAANWSLAPVSASGASVLFGSSILTDAAVSLSSAFTLGALTFASPNAYTLQGGGSLIFNNGGSSAAAAVSDGSHSIDTPLTASSAVNFDVASGASLTLGAAAGGSGPLALTGGGTLVLESDNTFSGGITATAGTLVARTGASLGTAASTFNGGQLHVSGGTPVVIDNDLQFLAQHNTVNIQTPTELSGALLFGSSVDNLYKDGSATLTYTGSSSSTIPDLRVRLRDGRIVMENGASLTINNNRRDTVFMSDATDNPRSFVVQSGAAVAIGGFDTGSGPSNTVHVNGGSLYLSGHSTEVALLQTVSDENGTDRLIIDSGSFGTANTKFFSLGVRGGDAEIIVNGGFAQFGCLSLGVRADNSFTSSPLSNGRVYVNGGVMAIVGFLNWMGDMNSSRENEFHLNGGELRLPATIITGTATAKSSLILNGGKLVLTGLPLSNQSSPTLDNYLKGLSGLFVGNGGADIDTAGNAVTITQELKPLGVSGGGLTKRGGGTLTFTNICSHAGATVVEEGTLAVGGLSATSGLTVSGGAMLSLANGSFDNISIAALSLGDEAMLEMEISTTDSSCDRIVIPSGATVGNIEITLFDKGTRSSASSSGTFPLFGYSGTPPDVSGWGLSDQNYGITCTFVVNTADSTIDAVLSYTSAEVAWANSGSGLWSTEANWWPLPPAVSNSSVFFMDAILSNSVVTVDAPVSVRELLFDNTFSYTLVGAGITLANPFGEAFVDVLAGSHSIESALTLAGSTTVEFDPAAELTLSGAVSGGGSLAVAGGGVLALSGTNSVTTHVSDGATMVVGAPGGYAAAGLTLDGGTLRVEPSDTLGCGITLGTDGGSLASVDGEILAVNQDIIGFGGLAKIGGGTLSLSDGILKYTGPTASEGGLLQLASLPAGTIKLGGGTLDLQGVNGSTTNAVIVDSGARGAVLQADGSVVVSGSVSTVSGCLVKYGSGSVSFAGALNDFGQNSAGNIGGIAQPEANGDGPSVGYVALSVANGRVVLGAPGQTNTASKIYVGMETTDQAGAETAGELEIVDGVTTFSDWSVIGLRNGSTLTAPAGLSSRITVSGGEVYFRALTMGTTPSTGAFTGTPELEISGGTCTVGREFFVNEAANGVSTVTVSGGTLVHEAIDSMSLRLGQAKGVGILRVSDGLAALKSVILAMGENGSTGIVEVTGGVLQFDAIYKRNTAAGYGSLSVDGGTIRSTGGSIAGLNVFEVGVNPLYADTSLAGEFTFAQPLRGAGGSDGGVVVIGGNALRISADQQYAGPTLVSNGTLRTVAALPAGNALTVLPGGTLDADPRSTRVLTVGSLTLGASGSAESAGVILGIDGNGGSNDLITVSGALTLHKAAFTLYINGSTENMYPDGTYNLIYYGGADPDTGGLSCANPRYGKEYIFSASGGVLQVTVGTATSGAHVWSATGGGAWDTGANWLLAPGAGSVGTEVRFDSSILADSVVALGQNVTLGGAHFNDDNQYTLSGGSYGVILDASAGNALLAVESGSHLVDAAINLNDSLDVKVITGTQLEISGDISGNGSLNKQNSGMLTLSGQNSYTGSTTVATGTLRLNQSATLGGGDVTLSQDDSRLTVVASSSSTLNNTVHINAGIGRFELAGDLEITGAVGWNIAGRLFKSGAGTLTLAGTSTGTATQAGRQIDVADGTLVFADGADFHLNYSEREAFNIVANNSNWRKVVFEEGSYVRAGGIYVRYGYENRFELHGRLDLVKNTDALSLRADTPDQNRMDWFTVFDSGYLYAADESYVNVGVRGPAAFVIDGGTADIATLSFGYQLGTVAGLNSSASHATVRNGGLLNIRTRLNWMGDTFARHVSSLTVGSGGTLSTPATREYRANGYTALSLDGGTLNISGADSLGATLDDALAGLDVLHLGVSGGTLSADNDIVITQAVASEGSSNAVLAKAGSGTLSLAQPLEWAGTVRVDDGVLAAELAAGGAVADPVSNLFCRLNFEAGPASDTSGNARQGVFAGTAVSMITPGAQSATAMNCGGNSALRIPYDSALNSVNRYTIAGWLRLNSYPTEYRAQTFFSTRDADNDNYQVMLRVVSGQLRYMASGAIGVSGWSNYSTTSSSGSIPLAQWTHFAIVVDVNSVTIYINGQYNTARSFAGADLRLSPDRSGSSTFGMAFGSFKIYENTALYAGMLDDMRVYLRALGSSEVASMVGASEKYPDLHVVSGAAFSAQGDSTVRNLSGEGFVTGALTVTGAVAPGDTDATAAGAVISVDTLNLAGGTVFDCTWDPSYSDIIVAGELNIEGPGVVDLGRDSDSPIPNGTFRTVLMYYDTISGAANLDQWTLANAGVGLVGIEYDIFAEDGAVVLTIKNLRGTLIILR